MFHMMKMNCTILTQMLKVFFTMMPNYFKVYNECMSVDNIVKTEGWQTRW